jgi:probable F420-dependent oxidoreductase
MPQDRTSLDRALARRPLSSIGIWTWTLDAQPFAEVVDQIRLIEELGFGSLWFKEDFGREALTAAALMLANTDELVIANGVASIYGRDATAMRSAQRTLAEAYPGRHLLAIGVSHAGHAEGRDQTYRPPLESARAYLTAMRGAEYVSPEPMADTPTLLAALGPRMTEVARDQADGAHTMAMTVEHTRRARRVLGPDGYLAVAQPVVIDDDKERARETARAYVGIFAALPNYRRSWMRLGFAEADLSDGGTDALVDAICPSGEDAALRRIGQQFEAGASHVAVQVVPADLQTPPADGWRRLAEALAPALGRDG